MFLSEETINDSFDKSFWVLQDALDWELGGVQ